MSLQFGACCPIGMSGCDLHAHAPLSSHFVCRQANFRDVHAAQFNNSFDDHGCSIGTPIATTTRMSVVQWRPRQKTTRRRFPNTELVPTSLLPVGSYAGRARFQPSDRAALTPNLKRAVGQTIEVGFAGIGDADGPFAGEALYLEWRSDEVLDGFLIPEQDLEFLQ